MLAVTLFHPLLSQIINVGTDLVKSTMTNIFILAMEQVTVYEKGAAHSQEPTEDHHQILQ